MTMRIVPYLLAVTAARLMASAPMAAGSASAPVVRYKDDQFGPSLATPKKQPLYYGRVEKRADGKLRCFGACAKAWPPLYAKGAVPKRIAGIKGTFGTV